MKLIVGLGNFEPKYFLTRHNIGFMALDFLALNNNQTFRLENKLKSEICKFNLAGEDLILIKPQTYMNLSGEALIATMNFYKINKEDIFVIYDDISLDLGIMRFRATGSDGGHNGIKSIINVLSSNKFNRLKLGIGPQPAYLPSEKYVLQNFSQDELPSLKEVLKQSNEALLFFLQEDLEKAQNKFN